MKREEDTFSYCKELVEHINIMQCDKSHKKDSKRNDYSEDRNIISGKKDYKHMKSVKHK